MRGGWNIALYQLRRQHRLESSQPANRPADVAFTMKQYVQTDLAADRQVANTLAKLIIGGLLVTETAEDKKQAG